MTDAREPLDHVACKASPPGPISWDPHGKAAIEVQGDDLRSALEAGLRAVLALALAPAPETPEGDRSVPVRAEGDDPARLFADLVEDLLEQIEHFGDGIREVGLHGVLRRDGGGHVAWGYATGTLEPSAPLSPPRLADLPEVVETDGGVIVRARLRREDGETARRVLSRESEVVSQESSADSP